MKIVTIVALVVAIAGCTTMQEAVTGGAAGGVAGFALAGPRSEPVWVGPAALS